MPSVVIGLHIFTFSESSANTQYKAIACLVDQMPDAPVETPTDPRSLNSAIISPCSLRLMALLEDAAILGCVTRESPEFRLEQL